MDAEQQAMWEEWLSARPPIIRDLAQKFPPNSRWSLRNSPPTTYYTPYSYAEDGTLTVTRWEADGEPLCNVFGINPDNLTPYRPQETDSLAVLASRRRRTELEAVMVHRRTGCIEPIDASTLICGCGWKGVQQT